MSQIETGIRSILSSPFVYNCMQNIMGARSTRREYIDKYMPFERGHQILDIGCGTGEIASLLPSGVSYFGYDMSERYIDFAARKFLGRGEFFVGLVNAVEVERLPKMDWVLAMGLLHHLDDVEVHELLQVAQQALKNGGKFIAVDPCYEHGQSWIARWLIGKDRGENVRTSAEYAELSSKVFTQSVSEISHRSWVPYTHNILVCSK